MIRLSLLLGCWLTFSLQAEVELTVRTIPGIPIKGEWPLPVIVELAHEQPWLAGEVVVRVADGRYSHRFPIAVGPGRFRYPCRLPKLPADTEAIEVVILDDEKVLAEASLQVEIGYRDLHISLLAPPEVLSGAKVPAALQVTTEQVKAWQDAYADAVAEGMTRHDERLKRRDFLTKEELKMVSKVEQAVAQGELDTNWLPHSGLDSDLQWLLFQLLMLEGRDALEAGAPTLGYHPQARTAVLHPIPEPRLLPEHWQDWQTVDVLVYDQAWQAPLTAAQLAALQLWLRNGGRLVLLNDGNRDPRLGSWGLPESAEGEAAPYGFGSFVVLTSGWNSLAAWERADLLRILGAPADKPYTHEHLEAWRGWAEANGERPPLPVQDAYDTALNMQRENIDTFRYVEASHFEAFPYPWSRIVGVLLIYLVLVLGGDFLWLRRNRRVGWIWGSYLLWSGCLAGGLYWTAYRLPLAPDQQVTMQVEDRFPERQIARRLTYDLRRQLGAAPVQVDLAPESSLTWTDGASIGLSRSWLEGAEATRLISQRQVLGLNKTHVLSPPFPTTSFPDLEAVWDGERLHVRVPDELQAWAVGVSWDSLHFSSLGEVPARQMGDYQIFSLGMRPDAWLSSYLRSWWVGPLALDSLPASRHLPGVGGARWLTWRELERDQAVIVLIPEDESRLIRQVCPVRRGSGWP